MNFDCVLTYRDGIVIRKVSDRLAITGQCGATSTAHVTVQIVGGGQQKLFARTTN